MPKPKLVHLIHEGTGGGGATLAKSWFPRYQKEFDVFCITGNQGPLPEQLRELGLRVHALHLDRPLPCLLRIPAMAWILRKEKPDIAVLHGQWGGFCGMIAAWLAGIPRRIYFTHMPSFYTSWDLFRAIRNHIVEKTTCTLASLVVCPSESNRYQYLIRRMAPEERFVTLANGIDTSAIQPATDKQALRRELGLPLDSPLVVSVGRLSDQKQVNWLIDAWRQIENHHPKARLIIVGDGPEKGRLEDQAKRLNLKRLDFLGSRPDGYRYFQAADVVAMTTMFEAQPYALLEAMATGNPIAATDADGVRDTITNGKDGLLAPPANARGLAEALISLLNNRSWADQLGQAARERVQNSNELDAQIKKHLGLIP